MTFREEWLEFVPSPDLENLDALPPELQDAYGRARAELGEFGVPVQLDTLYWQFRIAQDAEVLLPIASSVPWLDRLTVGFLDPEIDGRSGFGVIAYSNLPDDRPATEVLERGRTDRDEVSVAGRRFPVAVRAGPRVPQVALVAPANALAATWGFSHRSGREGWLVPWHAVDVNQIVTFDDGSTGTVTDTWGDCIDAVLVSSTFGPPQGLSRTSAVRGLSSALTVEVSDQNAAAHTCAVLDVDLNLGVTAGYRFPIRFSYNWTTSQAGDSGALITAQPCGEPVGMHQGIARIAGLTGTTRSVAYGLCLYQLEDFGGLEIWQ